MQYALDTHHGIYISLLMPFIELESSMRLGYGAKTVRIAAIKTLNFSKAVAQLMKATNVERLIFLWDADTRTLRMVPSTTFEGVKVSYARKQRAASVFAGKVLEEIGADPGKGATVALTINEGGEMDVVLPEFMVACSR